MPASSVKRLTLATLIAILMVFGGFPASVLALDSDRALTQYTQGVWLQRHGLPVNTVESVMQSRDGYLWLGTQEGLVRFDGVRFETYTPANTMLLPGKHIFSMAEAPDGTLWFAFARDGIVCLSGGEFSLYKGDQELPNTSYQVIRCDNQGRVWVGTRDNGLILLNGKTTKIFNTSNGLANDLVYDILPRDDGTVWVSTVGGLQKFTEMGPQPSYISPQLPHQEVTALIDDRNGGFWVGTKSGFVHMTDNRSESCENPVPNFTKPVKSLCQDRDGNLWIASSTGGLWRFDGTSVVAFQNPDPLATSTTNSIYEDREGSIWMGTNGGGLYRLNDGAFTAISTDEGLLSNKTNTVFQKQNGDFFIGTDQGLFCVSSSGDRSVHKIEGLSHPMITAMYEDPDETFWVGTYGGGLNCIKDGTVRVITQEDGLPHGLVRSIARDPEGRLWVGTENGLLCLSDSGTQVFTRSDGLPDNRVRALIADPNGSIWIGTDVGIARYYQGQIYRDLGNGQTNDDFILTMHQDDDGDIWAGTISGGLLYLKDGQLVSIKSANGLFDDTILGIVEDNTNSLWMSSNRGVSRLDKSQALALVSGQTSEIECTSFGTTDGMPSAECNGGYQSSGCLANDGRIWFPTVGGAVSIDPKRIVTNQVPPPVRIVRVKYDNSEIDLNSTEPLKPGAGDFHFEYTALSFLTPEQITFQYQLAGIDEEWVDAGTRREAFYTHLSPGQYSFRVRARNAAGIWNETDASFSFYKSPHFYETTLFRLGMVFGVILATVGVVMLRLRQMRKREIELQLLVDSRTSELRETQKELVDKAHKAGMADIAAGVLHNIGNILNSINISAGIISDTLAQSRLSGLSKANELLTSEVQNVALPANSKLDKLTAYYGTLNDTLWEENAQLTREASRLREQIHVTNEVIRAQQSYAGSGMNSVKMSLVEVIHDAISINEASIAKHGIELITDYETVPEVPLQKAKLIHILVNLLKNAKEAMREHGVQKPAVTIRLRQVDEQVLLSVIDNGPGIPVEIHEKIFTHGFTTKTNGHGFGLHSCGNYMTEMGGSMWVEKSVPGQGAVFILAFPVMVKGSKIEEPTVGNKTEQQPVLQN